MGSATFTFFGGPTRMICGPGSLEQSLGRIARELGCRKVLIVSDEGLRQAGLLDRATASLAQAGLGHALFTNIQTNPTREPVEQGIALYRQEGCDGVVAIGGGSPIDVAKAIAVLATNPGSIDDFEGVGGKIHHPLAPLVAVPTTCGTGSEATPLTIIIDPARKLKMIIRDLAIMPKVAILDPTLLTNLPARLVAWTGMDALTHAVESYTNAATNPISDALNIHAIQLIGDHLRRAVATHDQDSLSAMLIASSMAGLANASTRLGLVHGMANVVGGHANVHHGLANAILLPYVMEFNALGAAQRYTDIAVALRQTPAGTSWEQSAQLAVEAVRQLGLDINIPRSLREVGLTDEMLPEFVEDVMHGDLVKINCRQATPEDVMGLFTQAMG